jgi:hypothetical protein
MVTCENGPVPEVLRSTTKLAALFEVSTHVIWMSAADRAVATAPDGAEGTVAPLFPPLTTEEPAQAKSAAAPRATRIL